MDIRSLVHAQMGRVPYQLLLLNGTLNCNVEEVTNSPYYLVWFFAGDPAQVLDASYDVLSVVPYNGVDYMRTMGGHMLHRATPADEWIIINAEEYFLSDGTAGIPEFPINMNDGDAAAITTFGAWTWQQYDPAQPKGSLPVHTGSGTWNNTTRYSLDKQRFMWDEEETEHHNDSGANVPYHRVRMYDTNGWIGFNDVLVPAASIRRQDYL